MGPAGGAGGGDVGGAGGVDGGAAGQPGRNWVERADGTREEFGATCRVEMQPGDVFVIQTPGGGGFGRA